MVSKTKKTVVKKKTTAKRVIKAATSKSAKPVAPKSKTSVKKTSVVKAKKMPTKSKTTAKKIVAEKPSKLTTAKTSPKISAAGKTSAATKTSAIAKTSVATKTSSAAKVSTPKSPALKSKKITTPAPAVKKTASRGKPTDTKTETTPTLVKSSESPAATAKASRKPPVTHKTTSSATTENRLKIAISAKNLSKQIPDIDPDSAKTMPGSALGIMGIPPYAIKPHEEYMNDAQQEHFRHILHAWRRSLMEEVDRILSHMQDESANFPDPNDRATQEEEFSLALRARDRERKLIRKIDEALDRIKQQEYGYCETCGIDIGIRRLEARPTATLCIDCKTLDEIRERQMKQ